MGMCFAAQCPMRPHALLLISRAIDTSDTYFFLNFAIDSSEIRKPVGVFQPSSNLRPTRPAIDVSDEATRFPAEVKSMSGTLRLFVGGLIGTDIPPVTYGRFSHPELGPLLPNPIPDTVCCVPLLSRRVFVNPQNLVDELDHRPQSRLCAQAGPRSAPAATSADALPVASPHPDRPYSKAILPRDLLK
jgi:hypothetical protein